MKTRNTWISMVASAILLGGVIMTTGCGESAPPPAPAVEVEQTPEYEAGEAAYQKQG